MKGYIIRRTRQNQPEGYPNKRQADLKPSMHYGLKHNYIYYPAAWTDEKTGTSYRRGYYDENGKYYSSVAFRNNGEYGRVLCVCDYCGSKSYLKLKEDTSLTCPQCGAAMRVETELDEYTQDPAYTRNATPKASLRRFFSRPGRVVLTAFLALFGISLITAAVDNALTEPQRSGDGVLTETQQGAPSNVDIFGQTIYLDAVGDNTYVISDDGSASYDKKLSWDYGEDSYYDRESDCWAWYNTEVSPNLWQYWYEGISSDYGDYGWMEYEPSGWYVEAGEGNWVALPSRYDSGSLWHFEIDPNDFA